MRSAWAIVRFLPLLSGCGLLVAVDDPKPVRDPPWDGGGGSSVDAPGATPDAPGAMPDAPGTTPDARDASFDAREESPSGDVRIETPVADGRIVDAPIDVANPIGSLQVVSVGIGGAGADSSSDSPSVSADGKLVVFQSIATNLVPGAGFIGGQVYLRDRMAGTTSRLSVMGDAALDPGSDSPSISPDGTEVVFEASSATLIGSSSNPPQIVMRSPAPDAVLIRMSRTPESCYSPVASDNGFAVAFVTTGILAADDANGKKDVYVVWGARLATERISGGRDGADSNEASDRPSISGGNGDVVAFESLASNLVPNDTNAVRDVFARFRERKETVLVSAGLGGTPADGSSYDAAVSTDGQHVAFTSTATNLVQGDTNGVADVFVRDLTNGRIVRASLSKSGEQADRESSFPSLSADGRVVVFMSSATNLVPGGPKPGDEVMREDVYVHDLQTGLTARIAPAERDRRGVRSLRIRPSISANARVVVFVSDFENLVAGDTSTWNDVFAYEFSSAPWL